MSSLYHGFNNYMTFYIMEGSTIIYLTFPLLLNLFVISTFGYIILKLIGTHPSVEIFVQCFDYFLKIIS